MVRKAFIKKRPFINKKVVYLSIINFNAIYALVMQLESLKDGIIVSFINFKIKTMAKSAKKTESSSPKKVSVKKTATAAKAPKKASGEKAGKATNSGLMAPLTVSPALGKVIGSEPTPRTQIIKKIWDYVKENDLQDKNNRRMINADAKLKEVFDGKDQISMFELAKVINNHVK